MIYMYVTYKVKADKVAFITQVIEEFVAGISQNEPRTYYVAYQHQDDPTRFIHFMSFTNEEDQKFHQHAPHTETFVAKLYPECEEQPVFTNVSQVKTTK